MTELQYTNRNGTNCAKWDDMKTIYGTNDLLPLWVADMDFKAPQAVITALSDYVEHGVYGYPYIPDSYYQSFIDWSKKHHDFQLAREWICFSPGIVSAFNWIIQFMTKENDAIIVQTPVYYPFLNAIKDNHRTLITSPLVNTNGVYTIDFEDFEQKIINNNVKLFILCSPHNPVGRVWTSDELKQLFEICKKHHVYIISDEIHQDLTFKKHTPSLNIADYSELIFALYAPSKTFNLAGLQNSIIVIPDEELRTKWNDFSSLLHLQSGNVFGYIAAEAAFNHGFSWLEEVKETTYENYTYLKEELEKAFPKMQISPLEGTYLAWVNLDPYVQGNNVKEVIQDTCKIAIDFGNWFGGDDYSSFIRFNLATSKENIQEAVTRMINTIKK